MNININSWHYKIVSYERNRWDMPQNLCGYIRSLIFRIIMVTVAGIIGAGMVGFMSYSFADMCAWIAYMIFHLDFITPNEIAVLSIAIILAMLMLVLMALVRIFNYKMRVSDKRLIPQGVKEVYRSTFGKACYPVEYKEKSD